MDNLTILNQTHNELQQQKRLDFKDLFHQFSNYIDASDKTVTTYATSIRQFLKYMYSHNITQPQREDILAYRKYLKETGKKANTIQNYLIGLRQFFKWLEIEGLYPNVAKGVKGVKLTKDHKKDYLTSKQVSHLIQSIDTSTIKGLRDYAIIVLMVTSGLRTIEVSRANINDLRIVGNDTALFIQGKGRDDKSEYIKVIPEVEQAIRAYFKARGAMTDDAPLFASTSNNNAGGRLTTRSISGIVKDALINAGFNNDRLTAHSLRHTAGTLNLLNGGTIEETQQLLRHTDISTTMIYLHHIKRANNNSEARIGSAIFSE